MSEIFFAYRDSVGTNATVVLEGRPTLIKDLPASSYELYYNGPALHKWC